MSLLGSLAGSLGAGQLQHLPQTHTAGSPDANQSSFQAVAWRRFFSAADRVFDRAEIWASGTSRVL